VTQKKFAEMTDEELLVEVKKMNSYSIIHAFIIGFMVGIIIYSILVNGIILNN